MKTESRLYRFYVGHPAVLRSNRVQISELAAVGAAKEFLKRNPKVNEVPISQIIGVVRREENPTEYVKIRQPRRRKG